MSLSKADILFQCISRNNNFSLHNSLFLSGPFISSIFHIPEIGLYKGGGQLGYPVWGTKAQRTHHAHLFILSIWGVIYNVVCCHRYSHILFTYDIHIQHANHIVPVKIFSDFSCWACPWFILLYWAVNELQQQYVHKLLSTRHKGRTEF